MVVRAALVLVVAAPVGMWSAGCVGDPPVVDLDGGPIDATTDVSTGADGGAGDALTADAADSEPADADVDAPVDSGPACAPTELFCDGGCIQNSATNCGACGTSCGDGGTPYCAPTTDGGTTFACSSGCASNLTLCGTTCVDTSQDKDNCGGCGATFACKPGQTCSGGKCVCNVSTCPSGCCDTLGQCQTAPSCGSAGVACSAGCPIALPESNNLALWLVGDDYTYANGTQKWTDRSGHGANASCAAYSCPGNLTVNGHQDVAFSGGGNGFALTDPSGDFKSQAWTIFIVAKPSTSAGGYDQLFALYTPYYYVKLQRDNTNPNLVFQVINGTTTSYLTSQAAYGWSGNWERILASVDTSGNAELGIFNNGANISSATFGNIGVPANADYASSFVGTSPTSPGSTASGVGYVGEIAEIIVYTSSLSSSSTQAVQQYLTTRYGF